jgi:hypothetical protein
MLVNIYDPAPDTFVVVETDDLLATLAQYPGAQLIHDDHHSMIKLTSPSSPRPTQVRIVRDEKFTTESFSPILRNATLSAALDAGRAVYECHKDDVWIITLR